MNWTKLEDSKGVLTVQLEGEEWQKAVKKTFNNLKANLAVKGFRKGQVPAAVAKKMISMDAVYDRAAETLAQKAFEQGLEEFHLEPVVRPTLEVKDASADGCTLEFHMVVSPEAKIGDWQSIQFAKEPTEVTEEEVDAQIAQLQNHFADWVVKEEDEPAEIGDQVNIDYVGLKDGVAFEGGTGEGYDLVLGSNTFIPGFEDQLVGIKPEEKREIQVTFPEDYHASELAGQPVTFLVTAHDISRREVPEVNDELVQMVKAEGIDTVEKYKEAVRKNLQSNKEKAAAEKQDEQIVHALLEMTEVQIPEEMLDSEAEKMLSQNMQQLKAAGYTMEQYLQAMNMTKEQMIEALKPEAEKNLKVQLGLEAVADAAGIEVSEEEVENEYKEMADLYSMPIERIKTLISPEQILFSKKQDKAMDLLRNNA